MGEHDGVAGGEDAVCGGAATARTTAQGSGATGRLAARWLRGFCEPSLRVAVSIMAHPPGVEPQYFLKKLWCVFPPYSTHFPGIDSKNCRAFFEHRIWDKRRRVTRQRFLQNFILCPGRLVDLMVDCLPAGSKRKSIGGLVAYHQGIGLRSVDLIPGKWRVSGDAGEDVIHF